MDESLGSFHLCDHLLWSKLTDDDDADDDDVDDDAFYDDHDDDDEDGDDDDDDAIWLPLYSIHGSNQVSDQLHSTCRSFPQSSSS